MSRGLGFPVVQPGISLQTDRARRKARRSNSSTAEFIGVLDEVVAAFESDDGNFLSRLVD